jgi:stage V sporulation protein G
MTGGFTMEITDIKVKRVNADGKLKAYVSLTFDNCFVIHNLKVIEGKDGIFVAMPNRKTKKGEFKDIAHPINSECRSIIQNKIIEEYNKALTSDDTLVESSDNE